MTSESNYEIAKNIAFNIRKYTECASDNFQETADILCDLVSRFDFISHELQIHVIDELKAILLEYQGNYEIVESVEVVELKTIDLHYIGDI